MGKKKPKLRDPKTTLSLAAGLAMTLRALEDKGDSAYHQTLGALYALVWVLKTELAEDFKEQLDICWECEADG